MNDKIVEDICTYFKPDWRYTELAPAAFFAAFPAVFENTKTDWFREKIKEHRFIYACGCSYSLFFFCPRCGKKLDYMEWIKDLWKDFGDVPMNPETECIENPWLCFEPGTHREEIWFWFEDTFDIVVGELMHGE